MNFHLQLISFSLGSESAAFISSGRAFFKGMNQKSMFYFLDVVVDVLEVVLATDVC